MIDRIIAIYCLCDDFFKTRGLVEWHNIKMTNAEIMTVFIIAHIEFYGNVEKARRFMQEHQSIETSFSQITAMMARKIHAVTGSGIQIKAMGLVAALAMVFSVG